MVNYIDLMELPWLGVCVSVCVCVCVCVVRNKQEPEVDI